MQGSLRSAVFRITDGADTFIEIKIGAHSEKIDSLLTEHDKYTWACFSTEVNRDRQANGSSSEQIKEEIVAAASKRNYPCVLGKVARGENLNGSADCVLVIGIQRPSAIALGAKVGLDQIILGQKSKPVEIEYCSVDNSLPKGFPHHVKKAGRNYPSWSIPRHFPHHIKSVDTPHLDWLHCIGWHLPRNSEDYWTSIIKTLENSSDSIRYAAQMLGCYTSALELSQERKFVFPIKDEYYVQILSEQVAQDINGTYSAYFNLTNNETPEDSVIILVADYVKLGREFNSVAAEIRKEIPNIQIGGLALGKTALWAKNNKKGIDGTHDNNHIEKLTERLERELL